MKEPAVDDSEQAQNVSGIMMAIPVQQANVSRLQLPFPFLTQTNNIY